MINKKTTGSDLHNHEHNQNRFAVIPVSRKLNASAEYTGRGVRIAFLDSGFYPHPDYAGRVVDFIDISGSETALDQIKEPKGYHWHGTQTVVACAGNGKLSDGIYSGLAKDAELVLVKVSEDEGRIADENIEKALDWVLENHERIGIQIVNMSLGGDRESTTSESGINQRCERLIAEGVVITVAAGNSSESCSIPPASSPSAITVGGYSDENRFSAEDFDLYHSSFGKTADGLIKPEVIAPAMFVAAPILPDTTDYKKAEALSILSSAPDYCFQLLLGDRSGFDLPSGLVRNGEAEEIRSKINEELLKRKIVSTHYQHVDGTSFAAPIVASVVAQMLEANPKLTPGVIKNILVSTASRLTGFSAVRQGYGIMNARLAVEKAKDEVHFPDHMYFGPPYVAKNEIVFTYHDDLAKSVSLVGDFNGWKENETSLKTNREGLWKVRIPCLPAGDYAYKYLVDQKRWTEDPNHGLKENDGFGGFNSILRIA